jgi:filamentous hemagglutinin family protein
LLAALLTALPVQAQIVTDGSVGPKVSLQGGEIKIGAGLGSRRGDNLFHSFEKFGIATGQTATFSGPGDIKNVISRVTGGEISNIDGTLASRVGQADLYFLNPAGVVFGPNAKLDVPGSFHVSTAHELRFTDGARFSALDKTGSGLTVAPPEAFGFLDRAPKGITVDKSQLRLQPAKTLSLVGGDLMIDGGQTGSVRTEDGVVQLVSAAASGVVRIADAATMVDQRGAVRMTQSQGRPTGTGTLGTIDVSGPNGEGTIRIRGGQVVVEDAWIFSDNYGSRDSTGGINVQTDGLVMQGVKSFLTTDVFGAGRGGMITVETKDLEVRDGATLGSITSAGGDAGDVNITTKNLENSATIRSGTSAVGDAGKINIAAKRLELQPGGLIRSDAQEGSSGMGGVIAIQTDHLLISGNAQRPAVITTQAQTGSAGHAGRLGITAKEIVLRGNAGITSSTSGGGDAGTVTIQTDLLEASGGGERNFPVIATGTAVSGHGGGVSIKARSIVLANGAQVWAQSGGSTATGSGGSIMIEATDTLSLDDADIQTRAMTAEGGDAWISVSRLFHLRNSAVTTSVAGGTGKGGNVQITSPLMVLDGSRIEANAFGGPGGNITIRAGQLIRTPEPHSVIEASSEENVSGTITVTTQNTDVSSSLVVLPETFLDASRQLHEACAARGGRLPSSLTLGGQGGLPPDPGKPLTLPLDTGRDDRLVKPTASRPAWTDPLHNGSVQVNQTFSPPGLPAVGCAGRTGR